MDLINIMRFGYFMVVATFLLMIWVSLAGAGKSDNSRDPPCYFNQLCSCSKFVPDLGIVKCQDVHLPRIPDAVNISKVFMLHLENNGLRTVPPFFLQSTGLYKVVIRKNPLSFIPDEAFLGLERSLWELDLSYNDLTYVPNRALRYLQKLKMLDLTGNDIVKINPDNWRGLENSLETLIMADNCITALPLDSFSGLPMVDTIDLRGNNLKEIDPSVFRDGMGRLAHLILSDNQLVAIPYQALSPLKMLRTLDLSYNRINKMQPATEIGVQNLNFNFQLSLDILRLDYNLINLLEPADFQYFNVLNKTYLDGNPLQAIEDNAFRQAKIKELYLRSCGLTEISPAAFGGLENYLEILDLSGNNIREFPPQMFHRFDIIKTLSLRDNTLTTLRPAEDFNRFLFTLYKLDLSGTSNIQVSLQDLRRLRSLRTLIVSQLKQTSLNPNDFAEYGIDLEELHIISSGITSIKNNAFKFIHGLKTLDFSENSISSIENNAFTDIGHSLTKLKLSHALSSSTSSLPSEAIKPLINLEELDVSNNRMRSMSETSFHFMKKLRILELQDNQIELVHKGTFQGDLHSNLEDIYLSFNSIRTINQHTFVDLPMLKQLHLDDNKVESLERRSFMNLKSLKRLNLKGNKIFNIATEAFQNLPELEDLDMSYNRLTTFDFATFDQIGTLSTCRVNVSYNKMIELNVASGFGSDLGIGGLHSNIKILDLSHNNITMISKQFFRPAEISLTHLYMGFNKLLNATKDVFGNMPHLQWLDLSHNSLYEMDFDTFRNTKNMQVLLASHNRLAEIPNDLFRALLNLRIVDFSHNRLRSLPDNLLREHGLERLDVSHNLIGKLPLTSFSVSAASTLVELDLSWNSISSLSHGGLLSRFKNLAWLDLSYNRLAQIDAGTFKYLPKLSSLNLGHNIQLALERNGLSFQGLDYTLLHLNLDNVSLTHVPNLPTPHLVSLSLAYNFLPTVPPEMAGNLTSLQRLNLNYNDLTAVPIVTHSLLELRYLYMAGNPITYLSNTSLLGVADHLEELDISNFDLQTFESGALCKLSPLRTLKIDIYKQVKNFNLPRILHYSSGLKNLQIHMEKEGPNLDLAMMGEFPNKLRNITFSGRGIKNLGQNILQGLRCPNFHFGLRNTSIEEVPVILFRNMGRVKNLTVDVRDNIFLKHLHNPSTGFKPNLPNRVFLKDLWTSGSKWSCDCDLGWVEVWQRKKRQYLCESTSNKILTYNEVDYRCRHADDDLRLSLCSNKKNESLLEILKTDIECGWSSSNMLKSYIFTIFVSLIPILIKF